MAKHCMQFDVLALTVAMFASVFHAPFGSLQIHTIVKPPAPVHPIPGTALYTGIYYKLGMERFPVGSVTWTEETEPSGSWNYIQVDARSDYSENYKESGVWFNDAQWFFTQANSSSNWYTLTNRQQPQSVATLNRNQQFVNGHPIILKEIHESGQFDSLWKPVAVGPNSTELYKLIIKSEPEATVTWSYTLVSPNESDAYILQVDTNSNQSHKEKYKENGKWFVDTLFRFEPVDKEVISQLENNGEAFPSNNTNFRATQVDGSNWEWKAIPIIVSLVCLIIIISYLMHRRKSKMSLLAEEVNEFFNGIPNNTQKTGTEVALSFKYDKSRYEIIHSSYKIDESKCLGSGEFGMVYAAFLNERQVIAAVKTIKKRSSVLDQSACTALKGLISEIKILSYLGDHENIVKLYGANTARLRSGSIFVFLELCELGSLASYLRNPIQNETHQPDNEIYENLKYMKLKYHFVRWSREIATGMEFLASKHLVHADLATRNVLLDANKTAKIADFGLSRRLYDYTHYVKTSQEPLPWRWMAPESLRKNEFCEKTDVWAYGITLWEIYTLGDTPYPGLAWDIDFPTMLEGGLKPGIPKYNEADIYQIMLQCWSINPENRPTFSELIRKLNANLYINLSE